jgi:MFS family permease
VWNLFLLTGISGGALIAGQIIQYDGYQWAFGVCAIFFGILMFAVVFLVPETAYRRDSVVVVLSTDSDEKQATGHMKLAHEHELRHSTDKDVDEQHTTAAAVPEKKHTYLQSLRVFTGRYSYAPVWKIMLRPVILLFYPAVFWAFLLYGIDLRHN